MFVQDKTFGLKNKKGKKQQEFIKHVTQQVKYGNQSMAKVVQAEMQSKVMRTQTDRLTDRQTDRQTWRMMEFLAEREGGAEESEK